MTAPNTVVPEQDEFAGMNAMEATIQSTMKGSQDLVGPDPDNQARDAHGRFVASLGNPEPKPDGEWNVIPDTPTSEALNEQAAPPVTEEPQEITLPEGYVAPAILPPEKVQGFKVYDVDGEIEAPDLKFSLNFRTGKTDANGDPIVETRDYDLPKLVNDARMGRYNHELHERVAQTDQSNHQLQNTVRQYDQYVREQNQRIERLLSDPNFLIQQLTQYEQENTPEAKIERERTQIRQERERHEFAKVVESGSQFVAADLTPAVDTMVKALPEVSQDEIAARLLLVIEPYKVRTAHGTTILPQSYDAIRRAVVQDIVPWAQQLNEDRLSRRGKAPSDAPAKKAASKPASPEVRTQKVRRLATAALKPAGGNAPQGGKPQPPNPKSAREMEELIVSRSIAGVGAG